MLHPHNDYLRNRYDYGYIGIFIFLICNIVQLFHSLRKAKITEGNIQILFYAGAFAFVPFALLMITDNIILYAAFFGNLQFTILGMAYAAQATAVAEEEQRMAAIDKQFYEQLPVVHQEII
jgi:hypothetical protein